jgi:hypothetical protein
MPPIRERDLPFYANRAGDPTFPPPYEVKQAGMDVFICDGDERALENLINRALNVPSAAHYGTPDRLRFEPVSRRIGFACIDVQRMVSKPVPGQHVKSFDALPEVDRVYARQTEVAVMVQIRDHDGHEFWYLPYVLNGLPAAVVSGREIYGYPKQHATFTVDKAQPQRTVGSPAIFGPDRDKQWRTECAVNAYDLCTEPSRDKDGEAEFVLREVLCFCTGKRNTARSLIATEAGTPPPRPEDFAIYPGGPAGDVSAAEAPAVTGSAAAPVVVAEPPAQQAAADFLQRIRSDLPFVFLRQFRDPEEEARASYQAMVMGRLVPSAMDTLQVVAKPEKFSVELPWTYNLALAGQLFGIEVARGSAPWQVPVVGMLSGANVTFDVLRAGVLWQFPGDARADVRNAEVFAECLGKPAPQPPPAPRFTHVPWLLRLLGVR